SDLGQTLSGAGAPDMLDVSGAERASIPPEAIGLGELRVGAHGDGHGDGDGEDDYEWHVSLDGDTQGPFGTGALQDWLNSTPSGWDAHVWREGFPDWLDARACAELGPAPVVPAMSSLQEDELPTQTFNASSFEGASFMAEMAAPRSTQNVARNRIQSDILESAPPAQSAAYAAPREAASYGGGFSSSVASTGSSRPVSSAPSANASYTPGPNPGFASGEASGLIDIRALASLARQSTTQIAKSADNTGSTKNGALNGTRNTPLPNNGANYSASASAAAKGAGSGRPDSGLSFGNDADARNALANQPSGFGRFDSLAPVSNSVSSNAALPLAILGGCALVAAAVLAAVLFNKKPTVDAATTPVPVQHDHQQSESAATAMPPADPGMDQNKDKPAPKAAPANHEQHAPAAADDEPTVAPASVEAAESDELSKAKRMRAPQTAAEVERDVSAATDDKARSRKEEKPAQPDAPEAMLADRAKPVRQAPPLTVTPLGAAEEPKPAESAKAIPEPDPLLAAKPQPKPAPSGSRSIDDLLTGATGDKPASSAAPAPAPTTTPAATSAPVPAPATEAEDLPDSPSRDETLAAMRGVEAAVRACAATETITGTAEVAINVAGATGRVTSATVTGITGTVGSCIARAVRNARFPRFGKPAFSIKYPYRF
ncbi:MAG TPA: GYF domain-containing protein, partial [Polyangiales bacterium]|nr:GYF domain-containing protein [Polyangiales bacterium]